MAIDQSYVPIIKTTDAELRGYENLSADVKDRILPLFELTRSRKSKNNQIGDISKRLESCLEYVGDRQLILDLTTHESLSNPEIDALLSEDNDFQNWCDYIRGIGNPKLIPVVHALSDGDGSEVTAQAEKLLEFSEAVAFRIDAFEPKLPSYIDSFPDKSKLILILDAEFLRVGSAPKFFGTIVQNIRNANLDSLSACVLAASSFPLSVVDPDYGKDAYGDFAIEEVILNDMVKKAMPELPLTYGDYASIHPIRYDIKGGSWVPRVDVPLSHRIYYHRYRRDDGGYEKCAKEAVADVKYSNIGAWGNDQIENAANGRPPGLSPAFWISVRMNIHITRQVLRLEELSRQT